MFAFHMTSPDFPHVGVRTEHFLSFLYRYPVFGLMSGHFS